MIFISFSSVTTWVGTSSIFNLFIRITFHRNDEGIFYRSGEGKHLCLICDVRRKALDLSTLTMMLAIGFSQVLFIK